MTICLFLPSGRTFTFEEAAIVLDNETVITVAYTAVSDGRRKFCTIQKSAIVGWSRSED